MIFQRIIPRVDIKGDRVIKTICFEGLRVVGDPADLLRKYYLHGADEIIYMDLVASLYDRNFDFDYLTKVSKGIYVPLTVGGGIRTISDIKKVLRCGADKVAINTAAVSNPDLIKKAVMFFGSQCIVLSIEAKKIFNDRWEVYTRAGREQTGIDIIEWIKKMQDFGIGEILLSSVDNEGSKKGYETDLIAKVKSICRVPLVVHGGVGSPKDIEDGLNLGVSGVSAASIYHYNTYSMIQIKKYLKKKKFLIR